MTRQISIKTKQEIEVMRQAGKKLAQVMADSQAMVEPGITTKELDKAAEALIFKLGAEPAFKGFQGFPATLCTAVNHQIVHTVPSDYKLKPGDMLTLDIGLKFKGFFSDMAKSMLVGDGSPEAIHLLETTEKALNSVIQKTKPGHTFGDLGEIIQEIVENEGFNVVRELCGHGIGRELHQPPEILNFSQAKSSPKLKAGMVFCPEPMTTLGNWHLKKSADGHGLETEDDSLSCHFEHTVLVTPKGAEILTSL